jgi:outer membrane protein assembly factor BamB
LTPVWRAPVGAGIFSSPAVANVSNGIAYVGSLDGLVHAFNAATGAPLWTNSVGSALAASCRRRQSRTGSSTWAAGTPGSTPSTP